MVDAKILKETFEDHRNVISAKIVKDHDTAIARGFGLVEMRSSSEASSSIKALYEWNLEREISYLCNEIAQLINSNLFIKETTLTK